MLMGIPDLKKNSKLLGIAVPVLILLAGFIVYEYGFLRLRLESTALDERKEAGLKTLRKSLELVSRKDEFEAKLGLLREARKAENAKVIEGSTPSLAAAALQSSLKTVITSRGGTIISERAERPEESGKFKKIGVTIDAMLPDSRALGDVLYAIETQVPYLSVRELDVRIRNYRDPRELVVKLKIMGLMAVKN